MVGIEPTTYGLRNRCSTAELHWLAQISLLPGGPDGTLTDVCIYGPMVVVKLDAQPFFWRGA
jgi:hypothetical protein